MRGCNAAFCLLFIHTYSFEMHKCKANFIWPFLLRWCWCWSWSHFASLHFLSISSVSSCAKTDARYCHYYVWIWYRDDLLMQNHFEIVSQHYREKMTDSLFHMHLHIFRWHHDSHGKIWNGKNATFFMQTGGFKPFYAHTSKSVFTDANAQRTEKYE